MSKTSEFTSLWLKAKNAAMEAGKAANPPTMIVAEADVLTGAAIPGGKRWEVPEGPCGFAWVKIRPANCAFAKWLKKMGYGRTDSYEGGLTVWISEFNQSMVRKEAAAYAMAKVFEDAGIRAYGMSRMD